MLLVAQGTVTQARCLLGTVAARCHNTACLRTAWGRLELCLTVPPRCLRDTACSGTSTPAAHGFRERPQSAWLGPPAFMGDWQLFCFLMTVVHSHAIFTVLD